MKALVLIECQNEWLSNKGKLYHLIENKALLRASLSHIERTLKFARHTGMAIAHIGLQFQKGYPELANGKSGLHKAIPKAQTFLLNEFGTEFYETLKPDYGEFIVKGRTGASGFSGSNLDIWLRNNKIEDVYLVGYATHVCVESTMREAHDKGYHPILIEDATSAFNQHQQDYVINEIVHHFGEHQTTDEFLNLKL